MKKQLTLTLIIGLISLLGIIYVEISWLITNIKLKKVDIDNKIINTLQEIKKEITDIVNKKTYFLYSRKLNSQYPKIKAFQSDLNSVLVSAAFYLNAETISHQLKTKFKTAELGNLKFEYAILKNNVVSLTSLPNKDSFFSLLNMLSPNSPKSYQNNYKISLKYHENDLPLQENKNEEILYLIVFHNFLNIIKDYLGYTILIIIFFTIVILFIFYSTINFILRQDRIDIMKTNFINNMTHEFKTPIAAIKITTELLKPEIVKQNPQKFNEYINIIKQENNRIQLFVETILDNASLSRGEIRLNKIFISISELIKELLKSYHIMVRDKNGTLTTSFNAENDIVLIDTVHIMNAFTNIVENSIKYAKEGVRPEIKISTENDSKHQICIYIQDNGIGIRKNHLKKVFDKFYRVNNSNVHNVKGFGLGLNYTRSIIKAHKGFISIQSNLNVGTTIKITLPLAAQKT